MPDGMSIDLNAGGRKIIAVLTLTGLWPMAVGARWWVRRVPWLLHVPLTFGFVLLMVLKIVLDAGTTEFIDLLYILLTELGMAVKFCNWFWYRPLTLRTFRAWTRADGMYALRTDAERAWWRREHARFSAVVWAFWLVSYFSMVCTMAPELYYRTQRLPFQLWLPQWLRHERYYHRLFAMEFVAMFWNCLCNITLDTYNSYLPFHMSLVYRLLERRLQLVGSQPTAASNYDYTLAVIRLEQSARRLSNDCERILCWPMLFQVFLSMFVLCFSAYRMQNTDNGTVGLFVLPYFVGMVLQIYLPCYYANEITLASQRLVDSLYAAQWIELAPSHRRLLRAYMLHLARPIVLRAGGFFAIGLPLFTKVINNAYSLLALLLNMNSK